MAIDSRHVRSDINRRHAFRHGSDYNTVGLAIFWMHALGYDTVLNYHVAIKKKSNQGGRGQNGNLHKAANHDCHTTNWCN